MAKSGKVLKQMLGERLREMSQMFAIELIVAVILTVMWALHYLPRPGLQTIPMMFGTLTLIASIADLAGKQERVWTHNRWRLIPIADWKLYGLSTIANLLSTCYIVILTVLLVGGTWKLSSFAGQGDILMQHRAPAAAWPTIGTLIVFLLIMLVLFWSLISFAHMLTMIVSDFLPDVRQKIVNIVLAIIIIGVALKLVQLLFSALSWFAKLIGIKAGFNLSTNMTATLYGPFWTANALLALGALIISVACCYMLGHWVETKQA